MGLWFSPNHPNRCIANPHRITDPKASSAAKFQSCPLGELGARFNADAPRATPPTLNTLSGLIGKVFLALIKIREVESHSAHTLAYSSRLVTFHFAEGMKFLICLGGFL